MKEKTGMLRGALLMLTISSVTIMLLPAFYPGINESSVLPPILGRIMLWFGMITGYLLLIIFYLKQKNSNKKEKLKGKIGIISFFSNKYGFFADVVLILSVILIIIFAILQAESMVLFSVLFGLVFISAHCHCIFNGRVFNTIIHKDRREGNE